MASKLKSIAGWFGGRRKQRMPDLGARELQVLECLWLQASLSAIDIQDRLSGDCITLSTVQSTLERLYRKDLVIRDKHGRAYSYSPKLNRSQFIGYLLRDIADDVAGGEMASMVSGFAEYVACHGTFNDTAPGSLRTSRDGDND